MQDEVPLTKEKYIWPRWEEDEACPVDRSTATLRLQNDARFLAESRQ